VSFLAKPSFQHLLAITPITPVRWLTFAILGKCGEFHRPVTTKAWWDVDPVKQNTFRRSNTRFLNLFRAPVD
jgi:hypothetical protein